jgi:hypothetical protein
MDQETGRGQRRIAQAICQLILVCLTYSGNNPVYGLLQAVGNE